MREKDYVEILRADDAELRPPVRSPVRSREGQTESPSSIEQGKDIAAGKGARLMLAAERMSAASRLAEAGEEEATTHMLFGAIAYQGLAEEAAARVADRLARTYQEE